MAQGPQTGWPTWAVRIPQEIEAAILEYAKRQGYVSQDGSVNRAIAVRALLVEGLKAVGAEVMDRGQLTLQEATNTVFLHLRGKLLRVISSLEPDSIDEDDR